MTSLKRKRSIQAIDSFEFESFVRRHLPVNLANTLLLKFGITSYSGLLQCDNLNDELLAMHNSMDEKDRQHLFLYDNILSSSSPTNVKPGVLRELHIFRKECEKKINNRPKNEINSGTDGTYKRKQMGNLANIFESQFLSK